MRARDYITGDSFSVTDTGEGWWATTPVPSELSRYYPALYYGRGDRRFPKPVEWAQRVLYRRRARMVTRAVGSSGRVLDLGCGPGHLLAEFRALGWSVLGTEASEEAAAIPRARYGLDVRVGRIEAIELHDAGFDAIVSWHTLEHMRAPGGVLDAITCALKPGGVLFLSVPDFGSPEAQANPPAWFHLDVPRHLCHFPCAALRAHLERRGFTIEWESHGAPEYDVFSLVQTWQNRMRLPQNLLYLMLKSTDGASRTRSTIAQRIAAVLLAAAMTPFAVLVTTWRAWRGTGAVITFLARKSGAAGLRGTCPALY